IDAGSPAARIAAILLCNRTSVHNAMNASATSATATKISSPNPMRFKIPIAQTPASTSTPTYCLSVLCASNRIHRRLATYSPSANLSRMPEPYFQSLFAGRIGGANYGKGTAIYKFEKIKRAKRKALADHPERKLLDFGIGEN